MRELKRLRGSVSHIHRNVRIAVDRTNGGHLRIKSMPDKEIGSVMDGSADSIEKETEALVMSVNTALAVSDYYFSEQDENSLLKNKREVLLDMCTKRGIVFDHKSTKKFLVDALITWRKFALPPNSADILKRAAESLPNLAALAVEDEVEDLSHDERDDAYEGNESVYDGEGVLDLSDISVGKQIGAGGSKSVYKGSYRGQTVAVSVIAIGNLDEDDLLDIQNELHLLHELRHDNIVRFIGMAFDSADDATTIDLVYVLTEFCPYGDLSDYIRSRPKPNIGRKLEILHDMAFGVEYLHDRRPAIVHRDLKSLNILVDRNEKMKIADFGLSKTMGKLKTKMHTVVGTLNWQAPEIWHTNPQYTEKVDIYSLAMIFWEVINWTKAYPFWDLSDPQIYEKVGKEGLRPPITCFRRVPTPLSELIQCMWTQNPEHRPDIKEVVQTLKQVMQ